MKLIRILILGICLVISGCSSASLQNTHELHKILLYNLHLRRPDAAGAQPNADLGDYDYESHPSPNARLDCEPLKVLYKEIPLKSLRECLLDPSKMQAAAGASYRLRRATTPYLEIVEKDELAHFCFKQYLPKIPVPREIFFQSNESGQLSCYNSRMPMAEEEFLGINSFLFRTVVKISLSKVQVPETDEAWTMLLGTWSMIPFFDGESGVIFSKVVPTDICRQCMSEKNMFKEEDPLPPFWP